MKKILYYITDHGLGHTTRSIAIIRELMKEEIKVTVRNSNVNYMQKSLPHVKIIPGTTDIGPVIQRNGISINENETFKRIGAWINSIKNISKKEYDLVLKLKPNLIISDISVMPFFVAHKAKINSIAISNFSWSDVLKGYSKKQKSLLEEGYGYAEMAIQLPLGLQMKPFKNIKQVGLVCKKPTESKKLIRKKLGIKNSEICIFVNLNNYFRIKSKIANNIKIISTGAKIDSDNVTYLDSWVEGQNLVNASDLVVSKCGYGITSECLTNGIPLLYISDNKHLEQKAISDQLYKKGLDNRIRENELTNIIIDEEFISKIKIKKEKNETKTAVNMIKEML